MSLRINGLGIIAITVAITIAFLVGVGVGYYNAPPRDAITVARHLNDRVLIEAWDASGVKITSYSTDVNEPIGAAFDWQNPDL